MERSGLYSLFNLSSIYNAFQRGVGSRRASAIIDRDYLSSLFDSAGKILDVGCGPAQFLAEHHRFDYSRFIGIEPNVDYCRRAAEMFPEARILNGVTADFPDGLGERVDFALFGGVLHHMDDNTAVSALTFAREHLNAGGLVFTIDPVLTSPQTRVARFLAKNDRGVHVRSPKEYLQLLTEGLGATDINSEVRTDLLRIPYSHFITTTYF